jgi:hypothetical protein
MKTGPIVQNVVPALFQTTGKVVPMIVPTTGTLYQTTGIFFGPVNIFITIGPVLVVPI